MQISRLAKQIANVFNRCASGSANFRPAINIITTISVTLFRSEATGSEATGKWSHRKVKPPTKSSRTLIFNVASAFGMQKRAVLYSVSEKWPLLNYLLSSLMQLHLPEGFNGPKLSRRYWLLFRRAGRGVSGWRTLINGLPQQCITQTLLPFQFLCNDRLQCSVVVNQLIQLEHKRINAIHFCWQKSIKWNGKLQPEKI